MKSQEHIVRSSNAEIMTESFGQPSDIPIILIMGASASMIWWDSQFCERLAGQGFFVIRFDNRDAGRSTSCKPGEPNYSVIDMKNDILSVMDAYGIQSANLVGMSLGGMISQIASIENPKRVRTITLISSGNWDDKPELPQIDQKVIDYRSSSKDVNWQNHSDVVKFLMEGSRLLNGSRHSFDEKRISELIELDLELSNNFFSRFNDGLLKGGEYLYGKSNEIKAPVLIIHGTEDIVLPYAHALDLQNTIPNSKLLTLENAGHEICKEDWDLIINAIKEIVV